MLAHRCGGSAPEKLLISRDSTSNRRSRSNEAGMGPCIAAAQKGGQAQLVLAANGYHACKGQAVLPQLSYSYCSCWQVTCCRVPVSSLPPVRVLSTDKMLHCWTLQPHCKPVRARLQMPQTPH
jgi:hypothetical protein